MAELTLPVKLDAPVWTGLSAEELSAQIVAALNSQTHRERWKYTDVRPLLGQVHYPAADVSGEQWQDLPPGVEVRRQSLENSGFRPELTESPEAYARLCFTAELDVVDITASPGSPLAVRTSGNCPMLIRVGPGVEIELLESTAFTQLETRLIWIELSTDSHVKHCRNLFPDAGAGPHWHYLHCTVARDAGYDLSIHSSGGELHRQDIQINCDGPGSDVSVTGASFVQAGTHLDQQVTLQHRAPASQSRQRYHNLVGHEATVTFNGRIHIHPDASAVSAHLQNRNLALTSQSTINTKPELEILNDDVQCSHGATVGQLDESALFYCASRGIESDAARRLLSEAYLNQCVQGSLSEEARSHFTRLQGQTL